MGLSRNGKSLILLKTYATIGSRENSSANGIVPEPVKHYRKKVVWLAT